MQESIVWILFHQTARGGCTRYLHSDCSRYPSTHAQDDPEQGHNVRLISWNSANYPCLFSYVLPVLLPGHVPFADVQIIPQKLTHDRRGGGGDGGGFFLFRINHRQQWSSLYHRYVVPLSGRKEREKILLLPRIIHGREKMMKCCRDP